ncbi:unnamed protein product [Heterobilharzia americana]|nr:unnamed protein product [Heterobilharzia americana]
MLFTIILGIMYLPLSESGFLLTLYCWFFNSTWCPILQAVQTVIIYFPFDILFNTTILVGLMKINQNVCCEKSYWINFHQLFLTYYS